MLQKLEMTPETKDETDLVVSELWGMSDLNSGVFRANLQFQVQVLHCPCVALLYGRNRMNYTCFDLGVYEKS